VPTSLTEPTVVPVVVVQPVSQFQSVSQVAFRSASVWVRLHAFDRVHVAAGRIWEVGDLLGERIADADCDARVELRRLGIGLRLLRLDPYGSGERERGLASS
jgi:hypothetical protein